MCDKICANETNQPSTVTYDQLSGKYNDNEKK